MNYIKTVFDSLEEQKKFHLKNIGMIENLYDRDDYVEMMKEDYMISFHLRNATILNEYKNTSHEINELKIGDSHVNRLNNVI